MALSLAAVRVPCARPRLNQIVKPRFRQAEPPADSCLKRKMTRAGYQLTAADRSPDEAVVRHDPSRNQDQSYRSSRRTPDSECDCPQLPWVTGDAVHRDISL